MTDESQDTLASGAKADADERLPWYKRTLVIVALIGALGAFGGTFIKVVFPRMWGEPSKGEAVRGRVSDNQGRPLGGAKVSLEGKGLPPLIYTDSEGIFSFNLPEGVKEIKLRVEAGGYGVYDRRVDASARSELEDIRLTPQANTEKPEKAEMSGMVVDINERPLQGARVTLDDLPGMPPVETSSNGVFHLRDIPKDYGEMVRVRIVMEGYQPNPYTEDVVLGKSPPVISLRKKR